MWDTVLLSTWVTLVLLLCLMGVTEKDECTCVNEEIVCDYHH